MKCMSSLHIFNIKNSLDPSTRTSYPSMLRLTELLPRCLDEANVQTLDDEWRMLAHSKLTEYILIESNVDAFWGLIYKYKNDNNLI